jgi:O-antigen ligase
LIAVLFGATLLLGGDESLLRGTGFNNPDEITNGRLHFWSVAWRIFLDYPLLGAGLDSFALPLPAVTLGTELAASSKRATITCKF